MPYAHCRPVFPINGIILVGVCAAGKSTIARLLQPFGMVGRSVAQEHSQCSTLFLRQGPAIIVVLTASLPTIRKRRRRQWTAQQYERQWRRLRVARNQAHLIVRTDPLDPGEVTRQIVLWFDAFTGLSQLWVTKDIADWRQRAKFRREVTWGYRCPDRGEGEFSANPSFRPWLKHCFKSAQIDTRLEPGI
ncbi:MAG: hypothetical protein M1493_08545 [Firmicutes bacterium]|nr:hypothetical protein [Bacillota bacterium]